MTGKGLPILLSVAVALTAPVTGRASTSSEAERASRIIQAFVVDFRGDPAAKGAPIGFTIDVRGVGKWMVEVDEAGRAASRRGAHSSGFTYTLDMATLEKFDAGTWNPLTAMGQARSSDPIPMRLDFPSGYKPPRPILPFTMSSWVKGKPKVVRFGPDTSRLVHGGNATVLHYQPGFRSAHYRLLPGQHINSDQRDQTNEFPQLFIVTAGQARGRVGGEPVTLRAGNSLYVAPGISHEF